MKTVKDITVTKGRAKQSLEHAFDNTFTGKINNQIQSAVDDVKIRTGVITKFYPYLDKAEVELDNINTKVLCKILHRFSGDMIDFYTPLESEQIFDDDLKEPAIIPKAAQHVCVLQIHDSDSDENLILGYYVNEEIVGFNPASPGNMKLMSMSESNLYWIKFGRDGLECRLPQELNLTSGDLDADMKEINYANSDNVYSKEEVYNKGEVYNKEEVYTKENVYTKEDVYTKEEVYTKAEVDELIAEKIEEALSELEGEDTNDATH